jgi:hypothetical protein
MNSESVIYDTIDDDVAAFLVGKSIANIDPDKNLVMLNDGTELEFEDASDCCAWYGVELSAHLDYMDNVITDVEYEDNVPDAREGDDENYVLHVLSHDRTVFDINVQGNPTSGYYCHSFTLRVRKAAR